MNTPLDEGRYLLELQLARRGRATPKKKGKPGQNPKSLIGRGNTNRAAVRGIQQRLTELGYEVSTDGQFGEETEKALREFQKSRDALVDGVVGKETLGKLIRAKRGDGNKSAADTGLDAVERVVTAGRPQPAKSGRALGRARAEQRGGGASARRAGRAGRAKSDRAGTSGRGANEKPKGPNGGAIDPVTGKERATASTGPIGSTKVKTPSNMSFEEAHPRGEAGTPTGGQFVKKDDSGQEVENVQKQLNEVNGTKRAKLKEDGEFGNRTDKAVRQYQKGAGLKVDGIVGPKTAGSLKRRTTMLNKRRQSRTYTGRPT